MLLRSLSLKPVVMPHFIKELQSYRSPLMMIGNSCGQFLDVWKLSVLELFQTALVHAGSRLDNCGLVFCATICHLTAIAPNAFLVSCMAPRINPRRMKIFECIHELCNPGLKFPTTSNEIVVEHAPSSILVRWDPNNLVDILPPPSPHKPNLVSINRTGMLLSPHPINALRSRCCMLVGLALSEPQIISRGRLICLANLPSCKWRELTHSWSLALRERSWNGVRLNLSFFAICTKQFWSLSISDLLQIYIITAWKRHRSTCSKNCHGGCWSCAFV